MCRSYKKDDYVARFPAFQGERLKEDPDNFRLSKLRISITRYRLHSRLFYYWYGRDLGDHRLTLTMIVQIIVPVN